MQARLLHLSPRSSGPAKAFESQSRPRAAHRDKISVRSFVSTSHSQSAERLGFRLGDSSTLPPESAARDRICVPQQVLSS